MLETRDGPSFRAGGGCLLPVLAAVVQWRRWLQLVVVIFIGSCSSSRRGPCFRQWLGDGHDQPPTKMSKYARFRQRLVMVTWSHCRQLMYGYPSVLRFVQVLSRRLCWQLSALFNVTRRGKPSWPCHCTCKRCVIVSTTIFKIENIIPIIRDGHNGPSLPTSFPPCLRYVVSCCRDVRRRRVVPSLCRVASL